jgi:thioredoxin 1
MASANVKTFTDQNWQNEVLGSKLPVLVDFWAEWCGPCRALGPTIDQLADELAGKASIGKMDTDKNMNVPVQYQVQAIPTVLVFKDGKLVQKFVGPQPKADYINALRSAGATV